MSGLLLRRLGGCSAQSFSATSESNSNFGCHHEPSDETMSQASFKELPFAIILEICSYLNVETLIAMADVNKDLQNLSRSYKSYWLSSVIHEGLLLPLPPRPLASFSPSELSIATRRAVFRERNMSFEHPTLYSCNKIPWPYARSEVLPPGNGGPIGGNLIKEAPLDVCALASTHANGEWYFTLSADFKLRVVHLRSGILVLEEDLVRGARYPEFLFASDFSLDSVDDHEARMATITPYPLDGSESGKEPTFRSTLSTCSITLNPHLISASMKILAHAPLTTMPRHLAIAGDYALLMENTEYDEDWPGYGNLYLVNWMTGEAVKGPPLLRSFSIVGYPEYFISVGINLDGRTDLQVLAIPLLSNARDRVDETFGCNHDDNEGPPFVLTSIPLCPRSAGSTLELSDETTWVCHEYTGRTTNTIRLWIRDFFFEGCYSIFSIPVDFSKPPDQWFIPVNPSNENGTEEGEVKYIVEHKRAGEQEDVNDCLQPGTSGKRFFWWKNVESWDDGAPQLPGPQLDVTSRLRLFSSDITSLPPFPPELLDVTEGEDESIASWGKACVEYPVREMGFPFEIEATPLEGNDPSASHLYSVITEDWSGTVVMTLVSGDIIVLRYGHP